LAGRGLDIRKRSFIGGLDGVVRRRLVMVTHARCHVDTATGDQQESRVRQMSGR
jgi:hypothetical protein